MRQLLTNAARRRSFVVAATLAMVTLAASSPIYSAVSGSRVGLTSASPVGTAGGIAARADCSEATARQLVEQHDLNHFGLPNPVAQVLCGPFTGPGSEAMAITIAAPTCWPVQHWAVLSFTGGAWRLVLEQPAYLVPPLEAVGSDIRETTAVSRAGDSRCLPSGGTHARIWHWNGTRMTSGAWKQVTPGAAVTSASFHSPSGNIECGMRDFEGATVVTCWSFSPAQKVSLSPGGRLTICRGSAAHCKLGNIGEVPPYLRYGKQITVGRFRCLSLRTGVRCTVIQSGKGFLISRSGVSRVGR